MASPKDRRNQLIDLASIQAGYFTAAQARALGYSYPSQSYNVEHGNWRRVDRAIYRLPKWPAGPHDDLVLWTLWSRGRGVVSHDTALSVWELGDVNPARVHLTVPPDFRSKSPAVVLHRGTLRAADVLEQAGFRITTPLRSILDSAAGTLDASLLQGAIGDALRTGIVVRTDLLARADEFGPEAALRIERSLMREAS